MKLSLISLLLGSAAADTSNPYQYGSSSWFSWNKDHGSISASSHSHNTPRSTYSQPSNSYSNPTYSYYNTASPSYSYYNNPSYAYTGSYGTNYYGYANYNPTYNTNYVPTHTHTPTYTPSYTPTQTVYDPSYYYVSPSHAYYAPTTRYSYYQPTTYTAKRYNYYTPSYSQPTYSTNSYTKPAKNPYKFESADWHKWNNDQLAYPVVGKLNLRAQHDMEEEEGEAIGVEVQDDKVVLKDGEFNPSYTTKDANELPIAIIAISVLIILALSAIAGRYFYKTINMKSNKPEVNVETNVAPQSAHVELADENESSKVDVTSGNIVNSNQNQSYEK